MSYLTRLKAEISEKRPPCELTKPTEGASVSSVSAEGRRSSENGSAEELYADLVERAAIGEFDGGYARAVAERHARHGWAAGDWQRWHGELVERRRRFVDAEADARRWAYGAALSEWHARHGCVPGPGACASCGKPTDAADVMMWPDGARVHDLACAIRWGKHWRARAAEGLAALGIAAPAGWAP